MIGVNMQNKKLPTGISELRSTTVHAATNFNKTEGKKATNMHSWKIRKKQGYSGLLMTGNNKE